MEENNGVDHHQSKRRYQGSALLLYVRKQLETYKSSQVYQWEIAVQFHQKKCSNTGQNEGNRAEDKESPISPRVSAWQGKTQDI
eukprot:15325080-Ditylum_brightwellii.AAC.1